MAKTKKEEVVEKTTDKAVDTATDGKPKTKKKPSMKRVDFSDEPVKVDMSLESVENRDMFKALKFLLPFTDHRLFQLYINEQKLLKVMIMKQ